MEIVRQKIDSRLEVDEEVEVKLYVPEGVAYDSLRDINVRNGGRNVPAYAVFSFEEGNDLMNCQFVASTVFEDAIEILAETQCDICSSIGSSQFKCGMWIQSNLEYKENIICESCLESFLEIRDELLEEFSEEIVSEGL